jgi:hypothetical protein
MLDEITRRPCLDKADLMHGAYYKGRCRSATMARWNAESQQFFHWREKFGRIYVQTIKHPADESILDVFFPATKLDGVKYEIPFDREARFTGAVEDLVEFDSEMWSRV